MTNDVSATSNIRATSISSISPDSDCPNSASIDSQNRYEASVVVSEQYERFDQLQRSEGPAFRINVLIINHTGQVQEYWKLVDVFNYLNFFDSSGRPIHPGWANFGMNSGSISILSVPCAVLPSVHILMGGFQPGTYFVQAKFTLRKLHQKPHDGYRLESPRVPFTLK